QREWAHRVTATQLHRVVDVHNRADALFERPNRIEHVRHQQTIHDESGFVSGAHGNFAQLRAEGDRIFVNLRVGEDGAHDFDQLHDRHRIEKVHADKALLTRGRGGYHHLGDRQGRSVRGKYSFGFADLVERSIRLLFLIKIFNDGFDDDVTIVQV